MDLVYSSRMAAVTFDGGAVTISATGSRAIGTLTAIEDVGGSQQSDTTGHAGELRFAIVDPATFVSVDTNGDHTADLTIKLVGAIQLVAADFIL